MKRFKQSDLGRSGAIGLAWFALLILLALGAWTWTFRDGLGPDSVESSGLDAWRRFFADFWQVAASCFALLAIACYLGRRVGRPESKGAPGNP